MIFQLIIVLFLTFHLERIHGICTESNITPLVPVNWRNVDYIKHNQSELYMSDKIIQALSEDGLFNRNNMYSIKKFIEKLKCGESVNILILGGSFTKGIGCNVPYHKLNTPFNDMLADNREGFKEFCNWPTRFIVWLRGAYPLAKIHKINYAYGGTTSLYGLNLIKQEKKMYDLVLVDYGMNDHDMPELITYVTEMIIRTAISHESPIIYVAVRMDSNQSEIAYESVCKTYGVPFIPYRRALMTEINRFQIDPKFPDLIYSPYYYAALYNHHPDWRAHQVLADMLSYFITKAANFITNDLDTHLTPYFPKEPIYKKSTSGHGGGDSQLYCEDPLTEMTDMPGIVQLQAFDPYYKPDDPIRTYYNGWNYRKDVPAKPLGWIADSSNRTVKDAKIVFKVHLLKGEISISYLSTYKNAGKIELWLSYTDWENSRGYYESHEPGVIGCCSKKKWEYPSPFRSLQSHSVWIDTLDTVDKISQTKVVTFKFSYAGVFLLNIKHEALSGDELQLRGGDKVKLLGIRTC